MGAHLLNRVQRRRDISHPASLRPKPIVLLYRTDTQQPTLPEAELRGSASPLQQAAQLIPRPATWSPFARGSGASENDEVAQPSLCRFPRPEFEPFTPRRAPRNIGSLARTSNQGLRSPAWFLPCILAASNMGRSRSRSRSRGRDARDREEKELRRRARPSDDYGSKQDYDRPDAGSRCLPARLLLKESVGLWKPAPPAQECGTSPRRRGRSTVIVIVGS